MRLLPALLVALISGSSAAAAELTPEQWRQDLHVLAAELQSGNMRRLCAFILSILSSLLPSSPGFCEPAERPAFEVASVKPAALDTVQISRLAAEGQKPKMGRHTSGMRVEYDYMSLAELISDAYHVKYGQIDGPEWIHRIRFDILARMPDAAAPADSSVMLQTLLEQRFRLAVHRETREQPVLGLTVAKGGPRMKESEAAAKDRKPSFKMDPSGNSMRLESPAMSMAELADMLASFSKMGEGDGRLVLDMTGLKGTFEVALDIPVGSLRKVAQAARSDIPTGDSANGASDPTGPSLFESVQALGLKLEKQKAPVEQLIVDRAERSPSGN